MAQNVWKRCHVTLWQTPPSSLCHLVTLFVPPPPRVSFIIWMTLNIYLYLFMGLSYFGTVKPELTTTCQQRPQSWGPKGSLEFIKIIQIFLKKFCEFPPRFVRNPFVIQIWLVKQTFKPSKTNFDLHAKKPSTTI